MNTIIIIGIIIFIIIIIIILIIIIIVIVIGFSMFHVLSERSASDDGPCFQLNPFFKETALFHLGIDFNFYLFLFLNHEKENSEAGRLMWKRYL